MNTKENTEKHEAEQIQWLLDNIQELSAALMDGSIP
jgi:hypothetical protein